MRADARFVPALVVFAGDPARAEAWGRFMELRPDGGRLLLRHAVPLQAKLLLDFDIFGEPFRGIEAVALESGLDDDGYAAVSLRFSKEEQRVSLGRAIRRLAASSFPDDR